MKLIGYTFTYNEEKMIPYVMPYILLMHYDKLIVYDNDSTDNTVEELKKYDFIEIRRLPEEQYENYDDAKCWMQINAISECKEIANQNNNEPVWMSFTDFDEVLFCSHFIGIRPILDVMQMKGVYYFTGTMVQLIPDKNTNRSDLYEFCKNGGLCHSYDNMRGQYWKIMGSKCTLLFVNEVKKWRCYEGNHLIGLSFTHDFNDVKRLQDYGVFHGFHLKYIDYDILKEKQQKYYINQKKKDLYKIDYETFDDCYNKNVYGSSFNMDSYFLLFNNTKRCINEGVYDLNKIIDYNNY